MSTALRLRLDVARPVGAGFATDPGRKVILSSAELSCRLSPEGTDPGPVGMTIRSCARCVAELGGTEPANSGCGGTRSVGHRG